MNFLKTSLLIVSLLFIVTQVKGQDHQVDNLDNQRILRIDAIIEKHIQQEHIPGAVALIIKDGSIIYNKAFGHADIEENIPMKSDAIFRIASQSKALTSVGAMVLWERGKFLLDDPVSKYIPEFKDMRVLDTYNTQLGSYTTIEAKREITIRDLLRHTSGIAYPAIFSDPTMWKIYEQAGIPTGIGTTIPTIGEKMKDLAALPLMHQPEERFTYGLNIDLLGYLIEMWSGQPLNQFLREELFEPLNMKDTWFYLSKDKHNRLVEVYEINKEGHLVEVNHPMYEGVDKDFPKMNGTYYSGGAGLSSTAIDLGRFYSMYLNKGVLDGNRILASSTVDLLLTNQLRDNVKISPMPPQPVDFQFSLGGFAIETEKNDYLSPRTIGAFGWGGAFNTHGWADPENKLIGILLTQEYLSPYFSIGKEFENAVYQSLDEIYQHLHNE
ncbi:serine hydrolase domain-containing protein [Gracilimonas sp.]|uniref:serine hydrolase domain-containing protein n=1 Tax=Gracilimonas sp. TaxID=1974203 RepID=UPI0032EE3026